MDYESIARELIRALRAERSQTAFSRRLGYRSNVAYAWESGRRWPTAAELFRAAARMGIDLRGAFSRFYRTLPDWLASTDVTTPRGVAVFLQHEQGRLTTVELARRTGRNRYSVARWVSGDSEPRLPDFLALVEAASQRLVDFVAALVDPTTIPAIAPRWSAEEARRNLALDEPWSQVVLRSLEIRPAADPAALATELGLDEDTVRSSLAGLERTGQVRKERGGWRPVALEALNTRRSEATARRIKGFWTKAAAERLEAGASGPSGYNVFSVSADQQRRIEELHTSFFRELRAIVAEDEPPDRVVLAAWAVLRLDDPQLASSQSTLKGS